MQADQSPREDGVSASVCEDCSLLVEADHRIANHLAMLGGYVRLKAAGVSGEGRLLLETIGAQVDAVSRLHRALATHGQHGAVDLSEHLRAICAPSPRDWPAPPR
uniref:Signal transduction histidine kinase subgroup 2 dimerisation and phosphoacceptor domain-containing protein n=1 Tax=Phenylobacterium glaciei TaxID=2803784 RepID=A0A974P2V1_9CAUL|nr:hypothetical protein JKL49_25250 [Phenylobacterium glaciei]